MALPRSAGELAALPFKRREKGKRKGEERERLRGKEKGDVGLNRLVLIQIFRIFIPGQISVVIATAFIITQHNDGKYFSL